MEEEAFGPDIIDVVNLVACGRGVFKVVFEESKRRSGFRVQ